MTPHYFVGKVVLAFIVSLVPALLIRYVIAGRAVGRWLSIGIALLLLFLNLILFAMALPELRLLSPLSQFPRIPSGFEGFSSGASYLILTYGRKSTPLAAKPEKTRSRFFLRVLVFLLLLVGISIGAVLVMNENPKEFDPEQAWKNRTPLDEWRANNPELFARRATPSVAYYLEDPFQAVADAIEGSVVMAVICLLSLVRIGFPVAALLGLGETIVVARESGADPLQASHCGFVTVLIIGFIIAGLMYGGNTIAQRIQLDRKTRQKAAEVLEEDT